MTLDDFFNELKDSGTKFTLNPNGCIRDEEKLCPICSLAKKKTGIKFRNYSWRDAADSIDLNYPDALDIVCSADSESDILRNQLLDAVGVTQ